MKQKQSPERIVDVVGIGFQKCATTWIHDYLHAHSDVTVPETKELDFFSHNYANGYEWYFKHFNENEKPRLLAEISPSYAMCSDAPDRLLRHNPNVKILVVLRDPVSRAFSNHLHNLRLQFTEERDFAVALNSTPSYIEQSLYCKQLKPWFEKFSAEQILVLFNEDIKNAEGQQTENLCDFLGIDHLKLAKKNRSNVSYVPRSFLLEAIWKKTTKTLNSSFIGQQLLDFCKLLLPIEKVKSLLRQDAYKLVKPIDPITKEELKRVFNDDCNDLKKLLNQSSLPWENR